MLDSHGSLPVLVLVTNNQVMATVNITAFRTILMATTFECVNKNNDYDSQYSHVYNLYSKAPMLSLQRFYRAMHYSAKRGLPITCRLSVRLSICPFVTLDGS